MAVIAAVLGVALGIVNLIAILYMVGYRFGRTEEKIKQLEAFTETIKSFLYRRALAEMSSKGWAEAHSPLEINPAGMEAMTPFLAKFLPVYASMVDRGLTDEDMFIELEGDFGDFILNQICIPHSLSAGACLISIIQACKSSPHDR